MKTVSTLRLTALVMLVALPWMAKEALAHPYWPTDIRLEQDANKQSRLRFVVPEPPALWGSEKGREVVKVLINWCAAKAQLPGGWKTQDNRRLRTASMCASAPEHSDFGRNYRWRPSTGENEINLGHSAVAPGRVIVGVTFYTGSTWHHAEGTHTTLELINLVVDSAK